MKVYLGADHRGFSLKEQLKQTLASMGIPTEDLGATERVEGDDYDDYAQAVAEKVAAEPEARGIVICGSGVGVDMVANKVPGIRSGLGFSVGQVKASREDDDINILALPADFIPADQAVELAKAFLVTQFIHNERYARRLEKLKQLEKRV